MSPGAVGGVVGLLAGCGGVLVVVAVTAPSRERPAREGVLARLLRESGRTGLTPAGLLAASAGAALAAGVGAVVVTALPVVALMAALVGGAVPVLTLRRRSARRARELREAWPDAVDTLVSGIRAGMALPEAVAALGARGPAPMRPAFTAFAIEYRATGSFAAALEVLKARFGDPVADRVVASLHVAREVGGTELGLLLRTLGAMLREEARTRAEIEGRQSWTVAAARMAVAAPWLTLALLCTRPETVAAYATPAGMVVVCAAAALSVAAYALMRRIGRLPTEQRVAS